MPRTPVRQLHVSPVFESSRAAPVNGDGESWPSDRLEDFASDATWDYWEADHCYACGKVTNGKGYCETEDCTRNGDRSEGVEGPMMNYWYPLGDNYRFYPDEAAVALVDIPLCVVQVDGDYGLALTGGGMDLTWEIVEAFTTLGYLPPLSHTDLPLMAGKRLNAKNRYLIAACRASCRHAIQRARWDLERVNQVAKRLAEQSN